MGISQALYACLLPYEDFQISMTVLSDYF
jgi:hypothetical protein